MRASELVRPAVAAMDGYQPGEQPKVEQLVKLNTNENPYPPSPQVVRAIHDAGAGPMGLYPSPRADALREAASQRYGVPCDGIIAGNGSDEILALLLKASVEQGDTVAFAEPTYSLYRPLAEIAGASIESTFAEPGTIPAAPFAEHAKILFLCTPNSPTGLTISLESIAETAARVRGIVVVDEAYIDFGGQTALSLLPDHPNLVVTRTFSKSFSLAGLRLGLALMSSELAGEITKVKDSYNVSRLGVAAGVAALEDYDHMLANVGKVCQTRERVRTSLLEKGWRVPASSANFLWAEPQPQSARDVFLGLRNAGILVRWFDTDQLRHGVRISIGSDSQMDRFLDALA
jgi:histidinol-phosphate aminotransferase